MKYLSFLVFILILLFFQYVNELLFILVWSVKGVFIGVFRVSGVIVKYPLQNGHSTATLLLTANSYNKLIISML